MTDVGRIAGVRRRRRNCGIVEVDVVEVKGRVGREASAEVQ